MPVKLHATIINTRHRRPPPGGGGDGGGGHRREQQQQRVGFDGRQLLADWGTLDAGAFDLPALHISTRAAFDGDVRYASLAQLPLVP